LLKILKVREVVLFTIVTIYTSIAGDIDVCSALFHLLLNNNPIIIGLTNWITPHSYFESIYFYRFVTAKQTPKTCLFNFQ